MRSIVLMTACALALAVACGGDEAKDAADGATSAAKDMMDRAGSAAQDAAGSAAGAAKDAAGSMADAAKGAAAAVGGDAASACRAFAESGAWGEALEVCKKAHEMAPDDLALEHAYQQAQAAAAQ